MKKYALLMVVSAMLVLFAAACGNDDIAPSDPGSSAVVPDTVFFNLTGNNEVVLFQGRAADNRFIETVEITFDNGVSWNTVSIPPNQSEVAWSYFAVATDLPAFSNTVLIRVIDQDDNETTSSAFTVNKASGSTTTDLLNVFSGASNGDVIALSSGEGAAYGGGTTPLTIPVGVDLTVLGTGYGSEATSGGVTPETAYSWIGIAHSVASTCTVLEAPPDTSAIFSVGANLTVRDVRFVGAASAIRIDEMDASVLVEECLFDGQGDWAVRAEAGVMNAVDVWFLSSLVDASSADNISCGGLYLEDIAYEVEDSILFYMQDPLGPTEDTIKGAAVHAVGSSGVITESFFVDNALAIWASGGSVIISSCGISGAGTEPSYGINLTGGSGAGMVRRNTIIDNSGYGLRVGGEMELYLRRNAVTGNGSAGILIDTELPNTELTKIDMGTVNDQGRNLFDLNDHPDGYGGYYTQVYVTQDTSEGPTPIPANYNYWGFGYNTLNDIEYTIVDDTDLGGGRANVVVGAFYITTSEVGP